MTRLVVLMVVFLLGALPYLPGLNYPLLHDDFPAVLNNPLIIKGFSPIKIFSTNAWGGRQRYGMMYRPLWVLGVSFTYNFISHNVWVHRLINLLMHAMTALLLTLLLVRLRVPLVAAGLAGAFFALQAVHSEAVMFITNRQELQVALFLLLALYMALKRVDLWVQVPLFLLALFSKESAVMYPAVLLTLMIWKKAPIKRILLHMAVFGGIIIAYIVIRRAAIGYWTSAAVPFIDNPLINSGPFERILSVFGLFYQAIALILFPAGLTLDYGYNAWPEVNTVTDPRFLTGLVLLLMLLLFIYHGLRHRDTKDYQVPSFMMASFFITYLLFSNLLFLNSIILAERNLYLPSAFFVASVFALPMRGRLSKAASIIAVLLILANLMVLNTRVRDYRGPVPLYSSSLTAVPGSCRLEVDLALGLEMRGRTNLAIKHLKKALKIYPLLPQAYNNLGAIYYQRHRFNKAFAYFQRAVTLGPGSYMFNQNMCKVLKSLNKPKQASPYCIRAKYLKSREFR